MPPSYSRTSHPCVMFGNGRMPSAKDWPIVSNLYFCEELQKSVENRGRCSHADGTAVHEVDAHYVVPIWVTSHKLEYSAKTLRSKMHKLLPEYPAEFDSLNPSTCKWEMEPPADINWDCLMADVLRRGAKVPEIQWCEPGEQAALKMLMGSKNKFLTGRLKNYGTDRNNPMKPKGLSGLSSYLHFGQVSAQ
ncbi:Deoxyribodipyrimidine photo-lyase [Nymphaea thermarum]|nr:Deoxyribodipyrimidine photo-lyase [Nymphaea thermarum]